MDKLEEQLFAFRLGDMPERILSVVRARDGFIITTDYRVYEAKMGYDEHFTITALANVS